MHLLALRNPSYSCRIAPDFGGAIYDFTYRTAEREQPLMRPTWGEDAYLITDFASWPLIPFSNRIKAGRFNFMGRDYRIPVNYLGFPHASHGQAWERPWHIVRQSETACSLSFSFADPVVWPFPYAAEQHFSLTAKGLEIELSLQNTGSTPMPAGLGLHPYFPKPSGTILRTTLGNLWEIDQTVLPTRRVSVPTEYDFSAGQFLDKTNFDHCFDGYKGAMQITWPGQPAKLVVTSSENLGHFVLYTPPGKDFFCAEPVSHMPDAINRLNNTADNTGLATLEPGASLKASYCFKAHAAD